VTLSPARRAAAIAAGAAAVLLLGLLTYLTTRRGRDAAAWVGHTYEVLFSLEALQGRAVDAETGVRGYAATGAVEFLEPYRGAERDVARELARLGRLTLDNPSQQPRLAELDARLGRLFDGLDSAVALRRTRAPGPDEARTFLAAGQGADGRGAGGRRGRRSRGAAAARRAAGGGRAPALDHRLGGARRDVERRGCVVVVGVLLGAAARAEERHAAAEHDARVAAERSRAELEEFAVRLQEQAVELEQRTEDAERERAAAERHREQADDANRTRADFLASMSHELRTPLNAIQGYLQLLEDGLYGDVSDAQRGVLERVRRAQARLLALINDVLSFARLEEGRVTFDVRETDVGALVRDVLPLVEPQLAAKGLVLEVSLPEDPARAEPPVAVLADREKLGQVLLNLLSNSVKFTPSRQADGSPGRVAVTLGARAETPEVAYLRVHDTGIGIPRDKQDAVFEPFVQVSTGLTRTSDGTGLGLAISRDLVRGMGGDLRVRSAPGEGSAFTVTLRRAPPGGLADA
jgi:signal transduction histidine kinase